MRNHGRSHGRVLLLQLLLLLVVKETVSFFCGQAEVPFPFHLVSSRLGGRSMDIVSLRPF